MHNLESLGFVLAIDNCGRGCTHCPAHGLGKKMEKAPFDDLVSRLTLARKALEGTGVIQQRTIHSWRIGDMLDYRDGAHNVADVAKAWTAELGQPHYTVTNGSMGVAWRQEALRQLAENPEINSQVKLTVTPFDPKFHRAKYAENMANDIATLWPLTRFESQRPESPGQPRFRVNAKATPATQDQLLDTLRMIVRESGVPIDFNDVENGTSEYIKIKPVYDLRVKDSQQAAVGAIALSSSIDTRAKVEEVRDRYQLGVRTDGRAFEVDMYAFQEYDSFDDHDQPITFDGLCEQSERPMTYDS